MKRLLITGAAGKLGSMCRQRLTHLAETMRLSSRSDMGEAAPHEEIVKCDLADGAAVDALVDGCDGIVHLGGQATESNWEVVRNANIDGMFNLYEAARKHGNPRIVYASTNHTIGFYRQTERIDAASPTRPDSLYGVSKVFGEALASMYHDKFGIETACVRIGSCFPQPTNHRMLSTWMSYDDFVRMIECIFRVPVLGCPIIYGASANDESWWDNSSVSYLGWHPQDNAETYRERLDDEMGKPDPDSPNSRFQGGQFTAAGIQES
ncbi:NAD-dependent epimerase/dehydratase family protein [Bauldia sp.]|uniref:NAD-dependent epimerase/dehydratase family protein n=1 Tax=Bauldia sp. TaxID=2575872 RepID=UPI003BAA2290